MLAKKLFTKPGYWRPFLAALSKFPLIFPRRLKELREKKVSDKEIFISISMKNLQRVKSRFFWLSFLICLVWLFAYGNGLII
jgi:hypothetical protein